MRGAISRVSGEQVEHAEAAYVSIVREQSLLNELLFTITNHHIT
jgi:hypothetical protein